MESILSRKQEIKYFIVSNSTDELELKYEPVFNINTVLTEIGFVMDDCGHNEWEGYFWYYYIHKTYGTYNVSGSLYYGDFILSKVK